MPIPLAHEYNDFHLNFGHQFISTESQLSSLE